MNIKDEKENKDYYLMWSTVVDAPVTYGMPLEEFKKYYKNSYGNEGLKFLDAHLARAEEKGISAYPPFDDIDSYFKYNRAGENETTLDKEGILNKYCRKNKSLFMPTRTNL